LDTALDWILRAGAGALALYISVALGSQLVDSGYRLIELLWHRLRLQEQLARLSAPRADGSTLLSPAWTASLATGPVARLQLIPGPYSRVEGRARHGARLPVELRVLPVQARVPTAVSALHGDAAFQACIKALRETLQTGDAPDRVRLVFEPDEIVLTVELRGRVRWAADLVERVDAGLRAVMAAMLEPAASLVDVPLCPFHRLPSRPTVALAPRAPGDEVVACWWCNALVIEALHADALHDALGEDMAQLKATASPKEDALPCPFCATRMSSLEPHGRQPVDEDRKPATLLCEGCGAVALRPDDRGRLPDPSLDAALALAAPA
jgi:hypothetical protein